MSTILYLSLSVLIPGQAAPALTVSQAIVDRGEVKAGPPLIQKFNLQNRSTAPIQILDVNVVCGCQRPQLSRKQIPAGETAELAIEITTLSQGAGQHLWKTTVHYQQGDGMPQDLELFVKGKVVRDVTVEPVALALSIDKETTHTFTLTDRRAKPLTITAARCDSSHVKTQVARRTVKDNGEHLQQVQVTILDSFPAGHSVETLYLTTDDDEYKELRVPITVMKKAPGQIQASPEQVELRLAKGQTAASGLVRLRDPDDRPVIIDHMEADNVLLRHKWAEGPASMATLRLGVEMGANPAAGTGNVKVFIKEPKPQVLVIPISWQVP